MKNEAEKQKLIERAKKHYGTIKPCGRNKSLNDCFTRYQKALVFWFNDDLGTTHVVKSEESSEACV